MGLLLNLLLLVLGSLATLAAFGGKTWVEGPEPLPRRVTRRGWVSLTCLVLALSVGAIREIRSDRQGDALKKDRDDARHELDAANRRLTILGAQLNRTNEHLSRQAQINLITTLSRGSAIREGSWWLEFNGRAANANNVIDYLVSPIPAPYRNLVKVELRFRPFMGINTIMDLSFRGGEVLAAQPFHNGRSTSPEARLVHPQFLSNEPGIPERVRAMLRQQGRGQARTGSQLIVVQPVGPRERLRSASIAFRDLERRGEIGSIAFKLERNFRSMQEARAFVAANPELRGTAQAWVTGDGILVEFAIPDRLAHSVRDYWRSALRRSETNLYLNDDAHLMFSSRVQLRRIEMRRSDVTATFRAVSEPEISVGVEEFR